MSKHTPGPWMANEWRASENGEEVARGWEIVKDGYLLPMADCDSENYEESTANARLIAAAPDLLEALQRISLAKPDQLDHSIDVAIIERCANVARAAIAKATGEA